jgi:hypothetical protein
MIRLLNDGLIIIIIINDGQGYVKTDVIDV